MKMISTPKVLLGFSLAIGLVLAFTSLAFAQRGSHNTAPDSTSSAPLASSLGVFLRPATSSDTAPGAIASELQDLTGSASAAASTSLGSVDSSQMRRLVESGGTSIYAAPTDTGAVCFAITNGPAGCDDSSNFADGPMSVGVFDAALGSGTPMAVYGVIENDVRSVTVTDSGGNVVKATVGGNAFVAQLSDGSTWPTVVSGTLANGSKVTVALAKPAPLG